jgi:hypothetical protein
MKKYRKFNLFIHLILFSLSAIAQKKNYDVLNYTLPKGWKEETKENGIQLYNGDSQTGEYAVAVLLKSTPTKTGAKENFNTTWEQLVKGTVTVNGNPVMSNPSHSKGWEIISGYANFSDGKNKGLATLLSATGNGRMTNVVLMTNTQKYQEELFALLNSIGLAEVSTNQSSQASASPLTGRIWEGSVKEKFTTGAMNGYYTGGYFTYQYVFNTDGTYRFVYVGASAYIDPNILQYESGTYSINGDQLTITPSNGANEEWSVKGGPVKLSAMSDVQINKIKNSWDRRVSNANRKLQPYTYSFRIEYIQGNKTNALILEHTTVTEREGSGSASYYFDTPTEKSVKLPSMSNEAVTQAPRPQSVISAPNSRNVRYEVWESHATNISTLKLELKTVILSADKKCLYYMPEKGLHGISPDNTNETGSWGSVTDKGNRLSLVNPQYGNMELYRINATSMSRYPDGKGAVYKKCKTVDGLRFDGAYSPQTEYYTGKETIISRQIDPKKRPIIFFNKDGTYVNEGIEFSNITLGDPYAVGKGTYELINYSLILTTASGKKLQVAFTPVLDGGTDQNDGFIINNLLFYKLKKQFQSHQ